MAAVPREEKIVAWYWWVIAWFGLGICWNFLVVEAGNWNNGREKNLQELGLGQHFYRIVAGPVYVAWLLLILILMPFSFVYRKLLQKD